MGESDGGVLLDVKLNPEDPAKEFDRLSKKAVGLEDKLTQAKNALALATNEASMLGARLDEAKAAQARLEASGTATADQLKFQAETVDSLQARYGSRALGWGSSQDQLVTGSHQDKSRPGSPGNGQGQLCTQ